MEKLLPIVLCVLLLIITGSSASPLQATEAVEAQISLLESELFHSGSSPSLTNEETLQRLGELQDLLAAGGEIKSKFVTYEELLKILVDKRISDGGCYNWEMAARLRRIETFSESSANIVAYLKAQAALQYAHCASYVLKLVNELDEDQKAKVESLMKSMDTEGGDHGASAAAKGVLEYMKSQGVALEALRDKEEQEFEKEFVEHAVEPCEVVRHKIGAWVRVFREPSAEVLPLLVSVEPKTFEWVKISNMCENLNYESVYQVFKSS